MNCVTKIAEYSYKNSSSTNVGSGFDTDSGAFNSPDRIESAFGGDNGVLSSSSTLNVPEFTSSTPSTTSDFVEYSSTGPNGEQIRGYKKTFSSSTTSTKTRQYGGSGGSLQLATESIRDSISPIQARSSSSMSKLNQVDSVSSSSINHHHQHHHDGSCDHSHQTQLKRPSSGGEGKMAYTYRREEKREETSRSSTTPKDFSRKNVKWSDQSNKENIDQLIKDIDLLPDPDLDKG